MSLQWRPGKGWPIRRRRSGRQSHWLLAVRGRRRHQPGRQLGDQRGGARRNLPWRWSQPGAQFLDTAGNRAEPGRRRRLRRGPGQRPAGRYRRGYAGGMDEQQQPRLLGTHYGQASHQRIHLQPARGFRPYQHVHEPRQRPGREHGGGRAVAPCRCHVRLDVGLGEHEDLRGRRPGRRGGRVRGHRRQ